jgi:hypothetical protein
MPERIAVPTLTLPEVSDLFQKSLEEAFPKVKGAIADKMKKLQRAKVTNHKWVLTYEVFSGAKFNFYCQRIPGVDAPIVSIGMTHRTLDGMLLIVADVSNGGIVDGITRDAKWKQWVTIYKGHACERYARKNHECRCPYIQNWLRGNYVCGYSWRRTRYR